MGRPKENAGLMARSCLRQNQRGLHREVNGAVSVDKKGSCRAAHAACVNPVGDTVDGLSGVGVQQAGVGEVNLVARALEVQAVAVGHVQHILRAKHQLGACGPHGSNGFETRNSTTLNGGMKIHGNSRGSIIEYQFVVADTPL